MRRCPRPIARLLAAAGLLTALAAQAQIVTNGSFEATGPNLVAGSYCYLGYAPLECGSLPGWTGALPVMTSTSGPWGNPSGLAGWDSSFGAMQVGLQGTSYMQQTLNLAAGDYTLTWSDAGRSNSGNPSAFSVSFDSQQLAAYNVALGQSWTARMVQFHANGTGVLRFEGTIGTSDNTTFIDKVAVTAVPEPTSALLMAGGLAAVSLLRRRRTTV
jgi:hypothetical protein